MKRDLELCLKILQYIQESDERATFVSANSVDVARDTLIHHLEIMEEVGLVDGGFPSEGMNTAGEPYVRLTWFGHDFLELSIAKDGALWRKIVEMGGDVSLEVAMSTMKSWLMEMIG